MSCEGNKVMSSSMSVVHPSQLIIFTIVKFIVKKVMFIAL